MFNAIIKLIAPIAVSGGGGGGTVAGRTGYRNIMRSTAATIRAIRGR